MRRRSFVFFIVGFILLILMFILYIFVTSNVQIEVSTTNQVVENEKIKDKKDSPIYPELSLPLTTLELGYLTEEEWPSYINDFEIFWSSNSIGEKYLLSPTEQQTQLIIIPNNIKYNIEFESATLENKTITIEYKKGTTKIPRLVGHKQVFHIEGLSINTMLMDSAIYNVVLVNDEGKTTFIKEMNFNKPFYRSSWDISGLTWGEQNQLIFSSNIDGKWDLWSFNIDKDTKPIKLSNKHYDIPLNNLPSLGQININIPRPYYNSFTDRLLYHAEHDIWEIKTNGNRNYPFIVKDTTVQEKDGLYYFDNYPKPSNDGKTVVFRRIYDPMKSELWKSNYKGHYKELIQLPQNGFIEDFDWSPKDDQLAVVISSRESEMINGQSNLWILRLEEYNPKLEECNQGIDNCTENKEVDKYNPIKKEITIEDNDSYYKRIEPKKISTGGYKINSIDFSPDNKSIVFSLKLNQTTSDLLTDIWKVNSNNTELTRLTPKDGYMDISPVWSPSGEYIAFLSGKGDFFNLWIMDKNGEGRKNLEKDIKVTDFPLWSNNNKYIYIPSIEGIIYQFNIETGKVVELFNTEMLIN